MPRTLIFFEPCRNSFASRPDWIGIDGWIRRGQRATEELRSKLGTAGAGPIKRAAWHRTAPCDGRAWAITRLVAYLPSPRMLSMAARARQSTGNAPPTPEHDQRDRRLPKRPPTATGRTPLPCGARAESFGDQSIE